MAPSGTSRDDKSASLFVTGAASVKVVRRMRVAKTERNAWKWGRIVEGGSFGK